MNAVPPIALRNVCVRYVSPAEIVTALGDVSLDVTAGEFVGVLGASGSGKTTLLNVIAGLLVPDSGSVRVAGRDIEHESESDRARLRLEHVGVVFQDHNLIPEFSAAENVALPVRARGRAAAGEASREAADWLERVGIGELGGRRPAQLSGGQRQRVGIARALAGDRRILVADEPTGSLDGENSKAIFELLADLSSTGITVLAATHDREIDDWAKRVIAMRDGAIESDSLKATAV